MYPAEIELCLEAHPDVREAAVVGVDHPELGQEVKAIVVPAPGRRLDPEELARFVAGRLAYFKVPSRWELRERAAPAQRDRQGPQARPHGRRREHLRRGVTWGGKRAQARAQRAAGERSQSSPAASIRVSPKRR